MNKAGKSKKVVIFGAGKVGRGFLADLFFRAKWQITLVEVNPQMLRLLQKNNSWTIIRLKDENETDFISDVEIVDGRDNKAVASAIEGADLLCTAIGGGHLQKWIEGIQVPILNRLQKGCIDIIFAENHSQPAQFVREILLQRNIPNMDSLFPRLGLVQAQIMRSCIEPSKAQVEKYGPLTIRVQDHDTLPLDADSMVNSDVLLEVPGLKPTANFSLELTRKVFTYNAINAVVSYLGSLKGYEFLADAANDTEIALIAQASGIEASNALIEAHGFVEVEQLKWATQALLKYQDRRIVDPIDRQCRDPIRKLGPKDRLLGPMLLAIDAGQSCPNLAIGFAAALAYDPSDEEKMRDPSIGLLHRLVKLPLEEIIEQLAPQATNEQRTALVTLIDDAKISLIRLLN